MGGQSSRNEIVRARWVEILLLALFAGIFIFYALWWARPFQAALHHVRVWQLVPGLTATALALLLLGRGRLGAFLGLKHFVFFPPVSAAALLGLAGLIGAFSASPAARNLIGLADDSGHLLRLISISSVLVVVISILASVAANCRNQKASASKLSSSKADQAAPLTLMSFVSISNWLATDGPVERHDQDLFERTRIARRIAKHLMADPPPSLAVVGSLGAGKSTVRELTARTLENLQVKPWRTRLVVVELWPFETTRGAVEGIIRALIGAIKEEVNVVSLRGIPEAYVEAMSAVGGFVAAVSKLQGKPKNPYDVLKKIDDIAVAIDRKYVLWVEDLERFAPALQGASSADSIEDAERLNPIRALLLGLDELRAVNVVTATTTLETRFDLEKIARFVENIPNLNERSVGHILNVFRRGCLGQKFVDAATPRARALLDELGDPEITEIRRTILGDALQDVRDALPVLCQTPRVLKQGLRSIVAEWERLRGEIDFDDLLVATIVKTTNANAFAFVQSQTSFLRQQVSRATSDEKQLRSQQQKAFEDRIASFETSERRALALNICIRFLFSDARNANAPKRKPQGVAMSSPVDYWERLLSSPELEGEERDQPILEKLAAAPTDSELCEMLEGARRETVTRFETLIQSDQLKTLLQSSTVRHLSDIHGWNREMPPGFMEVWGIYHSRVRLGDVKQDSVVAQIIKALDECVPKNLALASVIEQYYVLGSEPVVLEEAARVALKDQLRSHLVERLKGKSDLLATGLAGAHPQTLTYLVFGRDEIRAGGQKFFVGWHDLSSTVLDALKKHPKTMAAQVAWLITTHETDRSGVTTYGVDTEKTNALFGSFHTVIDCFKGIPLEPKVDVVRPRFEAILQLLKDFRRA